MKSPKSCLGKGEIAFRLGSFYPSRPPKSSAILTPALVIAAARYPNSSFGLSQTFLSAKDLISLPILESGPMRVPSTYM